MTPKQKAEELVTKFKLILMDEDTECGNEILCTTIAVRCAKVAAETAMNTTNHFDGAIYWASVIKELNNM